MSKLKRYLYIFSFFLVSLVCLSGAQTVNELQIDYRDCGKTITCTYEKAFPNTFDSAWPFYKGLAIVEEQGEQSYIDETGEYIFPYRYEDALDFREKGGELARTKHKGKWGFINKQGYFVIPPHFDSVWRISEDGLIMVQIDRKRGYIDTDYGKTGEFVIPPKFDFARGFSEGLAAVQIRLDTGEGTPMPIMAYVNREEQYFPFGFIAAGEFSEGLAVVAGKDYRYYYIKKNGQKAFSNTFEVAGGFRDGIAVARENGKWGYIDKTGEFFIPPEFDEVYAFEEDGWAVVRIGEKHGFIDKNYGKTKKFMIPLKFAFVHSFVGDVAMIAEFKTDENGLTNSYINRDGELAFPGKFEDGYSFKENGLALVKNEENKIGFINKSGELIVPYQFKDGYGFKEGLAPVQMENGKWTYIKIVTQDKE